MKLLGVHNAKSYSGRPPVLSRLGDLVPLPVKPPAEKAGPTADEARIEAWKFAWQLPALDLQNVNWVGVEPHSLGDLGKVRVSVMKPDEQGANEESFGGLEFGCVMMDESGENGLPVPLIAHGRQSFEQSGLSDYPINQQGPHGQIVPTRRVKTLGALLQEPDIWPKDHQWVIPYMPVYHLTALMPVPVAGAAGPARFSADYQFVVEGNRGLIICPIIEDRITGRSYNKQGSMSFGRSGMLVRDLTAEDGGPLTHCLFRAEQAPSLNKAAGDAAPSVMGRVVTLVMQQPEPRVIPSLDDALTRTAFMGSRSASIAQSHVVKGKSLSPVTIGEGVEIDPAKLPTIFDVRVLTVSAGEEITAGDLEQGAKILPFTG